MSNTDSMRWSELLYGQQSSSSSSSSSQQNQQNPQQQQGGGVGVQPNGPGVDAVPQQQQQQQQAPGGAPLGGFSAPTIKNHSVTHFSGYLYCFGGYDGRRNHMTLLIYSIAEQRWIQPVIVHGSPSSNATSAGSVGAGNFSNAGDSVASLLHQHHHAAAAAAAAASLDGSHHHHHGGGNSSTSPIFVTGTPPPGRNGHSATLAVDEEDDSIGRIIIIGGWLGTGPLAASDMHVLDVHVSPNGQQHLQWYQPAVKGTPPGPCNMHSADYVPKCKSVYVFRGGNGREYLNDLHALNVKTLMWRRVETVGEIPQQRANHSSAMMEETGELFIFGGWNGVERLNDVHILDTATSTWTRPHISGVLPHPRAGMTLTALRGRLFLFGGSGTSAKCFQDLQILDRREMAWLDVTPYNEASHHQQQSAHNAHHNQHRHPIYGADEHDLNGRFQFGGPNICCPYDDVGGGLGSGNNSSGNSGAASAAALGYQGAEPDHDASQQGQNSSNNNNPYYRSPQQQGGDSAISAMVLGGNISRGFSGVRPFSGTSAAASASNNNQANTATAGAASATGATAPTAPHRYYHHHQQSSPNPNDEDTVPVVLIHGRGPGRRAGHTATAVHRKIYVFGGSCGSDYLNDFFVLDTDPPPVARISQLNSLQLMERRLGHFFNDEEFSDVTFVVQGQKVYGHKMVLSIVSDCFRAMFTAGFRESEAMEIEIPDCSHAAFLAVMKYIYTGSLPKSVTDYGNSSSSSSIFNAQSASDQYQQHHQQQPQLHSGSFGSSSSSSSQQVNRVVELLELADRFFLDHLKQICETLLQPAVNSETVEYLAGVAQKTNAAQLQAVCDHFVRNRQGI